tara:strand:+ start:1519 stop:1803 length:285 start_codon:yes stop_codon:yes gene_type:complete
MRCLYATFLQNLHSFNNSALYIGGIKANKMQLVPMIVDARQQLQAELTDALERQSFGYAERVAGNLRDLDAKTKSLCLSKDVAFEVAYRTPVRG